MYGDYGDEEFDMGLGGGFGGDFDFEGDSSNPDKEDMAMIEVVFKNT